MATTSNSPDSMNQEPPSVAVKAEERIDNPGIIDEGKSPSKQRDNANDSMEIDETKDCNDPDKGKDTEKRQRAWSLGGTEEMEPTKKIRVDDNNEIGVTSPVLKARNQPHPSPVLIANSWPQRSPMDPKHSQLGGDEYHCQIDETQASANASSSTPSTRSREQEHDEVAHALFTESFETISACASPTIQEGTCDDDDGVLSPRQKTHTPTDETAIGLLSPRDEAPRRNESRHVNDSPNDSMARNRENQHRYNSSLETHEDNAHHRGQYHENSPHSPPQRVVHVDGDDNGCGDISPIKFSPPTESSPSRHQGGFPANFDTGHQYSRFDSTPLNDSNEQQQHAAEISFDTSAGNHSYRHDNREPNTNDIHNRRGEDEQDGRSPSYSTSTLSEAKTPPRRGTSGAAHYGKGTGPAKHVYEPVYSMAPPIPPPDISHPQYAGSYYPHHPPMLSEGAALNHRDPSRVHYSGRVNPPSPIRPSRTPYGSDRMKQDPHRLYREAPTSRVGPPAYIGGPPWLGNRYAAEPREYPPPRARLPPPQSYWNPPPNHQHHPSQQISTQGHAKGRLVPPSAPRSRHLPPPPPPPPRYHHPFAPPSSAALVPGATQKDPFDLFRSVRKIFQGCSYLLYPAHMGVHWKGGHQTTHTDPHDLKVARRRIESAICALGGYIKDIQEREESPSTSPSSSGRSQQPTPSSSVFRRRHADHYYRNNSNSNSSILRSSSTNSSDNYYRDRFHHRYFVGDHGVSWDVEENPPVFVSLDEDDSVHKNRNVASSSRNNSGGTARVGIPKSSGDRMEGGALLKQEENRPPQPQEQPPFKPDPSFPMCQPIGTPMTDLDLIQMNQLNQKMKYRCKLCGQPKQNHVCPYRKSLVRTISVMVCPAVNAYISAEPGVLTPPLSEMNNFVPYGRPGDEGSTDLDDTEVSSSSQRDHHSSSSSYSMAPGGSNKTNRRRQQHHSPTSSSLSTSLHSNSDGHRSPGENQPPGYHQKNYLSQRQRRGSLWQQPKSRLEYHHQKPLFMTLSLRPEHYRAVTPRTPYRNSTSEEQRDDREEGSYEYPHVPLTFLGRKRLTDTLFFLSQKIPSVTADVASLLRMARERDEWDLAVAEVLTQVVVCIHCNDGDYQLDGLKNYLLKIGISS